MDVVAVVRSRKILGHHDLAVCSLTTLAGAEFTISRNLPAHSVSPFGIGFATAALAGGGDCEPY
jgi:hypothetical protein